MARKRIGEMLLERGAISVEQLEAGLAHQRTARVRLGLALIEKGYVSEDTLAQVLSEALAIPRVDLAALTPDWSAVHMLRATFCELHDLFPFSLESKGTRKQLLVAMSDPLNVPAVEEIEFSTGLKVSPRLATVSSVRQAIRRYYHKLPAETAPPGQMTVVSRGGETRVVDIEAGEEEIIEGEPITTHEVTERTALAQLIQSREEAHRGRRERPPKIKAEAVASDLDYLLGADEDGVEKLERKFWALMRIMARKGLITRDEFLQELDEKE